MSIKIAVSLTLNFLHLSFGEPREAVTEEVGNIGIRIDERTKEVVGLTIIEFMKTFGRTHKPIKIPVSEIINPQ